MKYLQLFDRKMIGRGPDNKDYLLRHTLLGLGVDSNLFSIKFHQILISDEECLHNHPWPFLSLMLKGSYTEYIQALPWKRRRTWSAPKFSDKNSFPVQHKTFSAPCILFRPASWNHRLQLDKPVWTLVITGPKIQTWGFFTKWGWVHWKEYREAKDC